MFKFIGYKRRNPEPDAAETLPVHVERHLWSRLFESKLSVAGLVLLSSENVPLIVQ
jgi:hypothetical protein